MANIALGCLIGIIATYLMYAWKGVRFSLPVVMYCSLEDFPDGKPFTVIGVFRGPLMAIKDPRGVMLCQINEEQMMRLFLLRPPGCLELTTEKAALTLPLAK